MTGPTFLRRRWFLLALLGGVLIAWLRPQWLGWTGALDPRLVVAPALFLMAWGLPSRKLLGAARRPGPALWAVVVSYGFLPACGLLAGLLLPLADFRIGLLISCCVPCTLASAVLWTRMAGGDEATALLVTVLTTASSWLVTTSWLALATGAAVAVAPAAMMLDLALSLVLPVGLGQACRAARPLANLATRQKVLLGVVSQVLILLIIFKGARTALARLGEGSADVTVVAVLGAVGSCVVVHLAALTCGMWGGQFLGFDRSSRVAVAFACSQKTFPVALLLFERYFQAEYPLAVVPLAAYHVGQLIVDTFIADRLRTSSSVLE